MGKGGQNNTYKINGGGKGSACDSVPSRGSADMTRFLLLISRVTFFGGKALVSQYLSAMYSCKGTYIHSMLQEKKVQFFIQIYLFNKNKANLISKGGRDSGKGGANAPPPPPPPK